MLSLTSPGVPDVEPRRARESVGWLTVPWWTIYGIGLLWVMLGTICIMPSADLSTAPSGIGVSDAVAGALGCLGDGEGDDGDVDGELDDGVSRKSSYTRS